MCGWLFLCVDRVACQNEVNSQCNLGPVGGDGGAALLGAKPDPSAGGDNAVAMSWWRWQLSTIATATRDDGGWRDVPTYCCYYYYHSSLGYGMDDQLATTLRDLDNCCILASSSSAESDDDCEPGWTGSAGGSHVAGDYAYEPGWTGSAGGSPVDGGCSDAVSLDGPVPPGAAPRVPMQRGLGDHGLPH